MPTATEILAFLDQQRSGTIDRREIASRPFSLVRKSLRSIIMRLRDTEEASAVEASERLRWALSEWLTVPIPFDSNVASALDSLGDQHAISARWGDDIGGAYKVAHDAMAHLIEAENPLRVEVREVIRGLVQSKRSFRIICHRTARTHFESLLDQPLDAITFLRSVKDYRESALFDVLIKVGPLRSKGWGAAPDAILTSPRFDLLRQVVWTGSLDEEGFGYDPVAPAAVSEAIGGAVGTLEADRNRVGWTRHVSSSGQKDMDADLVAVDEDEFKLFANLGRGTDLRRATLVQIDEEHGVFYPPQADILSFDATAGSDGISRRVPGDTLAPGMFVISPLVGDPDLGTLRAGEGHYSSVWKERLRQELRRDPRGLVQKLRNAGIELLNLRSCAEFWCLRASTVIHAPKRGRHFEILIKSLNLDTEVTTSMRPSRRPWWQNAWAEIVKSRSAAIQTGIHEHEIIEDQLLGVLQELFPQIMESASENAVFELEIPDGRSLQGSVQFLKVLSVENDFMVPETMLRIIIELDAIEQWRV